MIKFKNDLDKKEFEILGLSEEDYFKKLDYITKLNLIKINSVKNNSKIFTDEEILKIKDKWSVTKGKRFIKKINENIKILKEKNNINYFDKLNFLISLNSIKTHLFIELEYYESDFEKLQLFLLHIKNDIKKISEIEEIIFENLYNNEFKDFKKLLEIFEFYSNDF